MELLTYVGRAGDRNDRAMKGAAILADALGRRLGRKARRVGEARPAVAGGWAEQLALARGDLQGLAGAIDDALARGCRPLTTMGRCAAALATLPVVARHRPDATILWFDAHGDSNVPEGRPASSYLGGMVLTGAAGCWETGLGADLDLGKVILVGSRDLDPAERDLVARGVTRLVPPGPAFVERLRAAIGAEPLYVHVDCDVLEPGLVPTEYRVSGGLSLAELRGAAAVIARNPLVGLEIAELEAEETDGTPASLDGLVTALEPLVLR